MSEPVRVFVSHSHKDDSFTARLVGDLRSAGADVWVDTTEIAYDDFLKRINEGLAGRQWLVLVMTPDALKSRYVQMEVNAALHQVIEGRMRAVVPILAKSCTLGDIPVTWAPLHRYDATRDYSSAFAGLSYALGLAPPAAVGPAPAPAVRVQSAPAAKPAESQPPARVVDPSGRGDHRTIVDAVNAAKPGERILVRPGKYRGDLDIRKPLEIVGDGARDDIVIEGVGKNAIYYNAAGLLRLAHLTVRQFGKEYAIEIYHGGPALIEDCAITSSSAQAVSVMSGPVLTMRGSLVNAQGSWPVRIGYGGTATIESCDIRGGPSAAVCVLGNATIRNSRIVSTSGASIEVKGSCTAEDNDLRGSGKGAWIGADKAKRARNRE